MMTIQELFRYGSAPLAVWICVLAVLFGAAMGSFLNCAAWRIARGESFLRGRSRCPRCGHTLGPPDLVPLLSWLFLRGKCRHCGAPIPVRYELTECAFAALTVLCLLRSGLGPEGLRDYIFLCCLFCLSLVDLDSYTIPDGCLIVPVVAWTAVLPWTGHGPGWIGTHVLAGIVYGGGMLALSLVMDRVLGRESLGGGDIKLFAVTGLYLGLAGTLFALLLACILGLLFALALRRGRSQPFPFGPAIAAAAAGMLFFGDPLVAWYVGLLSV